MSLNDLPRPRIQRAFIRWFEKNRCRFKIPCRITEIRGDSVQLKFVNYPDCLSVRMGKNSLDVVVDWRGQCWDMLISLDLSVNKLPAGYECKFCTMHTGGSTVFPNRDVLWQDHFFEPFLRWVNEQLAYARWLEISTSESGGATWANLKRDSERSPTLGSFGNKHWIIDLVGERDLNWNA